MKTKFHICLLFTLALSACGSAPPRLPEPLSEALRARTAASNAFEAGRYREALRNFQDAERRFVAIDDDVNAAWAAISQAEILLLFGEIERAATVTNRAALRTVEQDSTVQDHVQWLQARIRHEKNDESVDQQLEQLLDASPAVAQQAQVLLCQRALSAECVSALSSSNPLTHARIERLRADVLAVGNEHAQARVHLDNALNIYRDHYYRPGIAAVYETQAEHNAAAGDTAAATASLRRALYLRLWIHDGVHAARVLQRLAELSATTEDRDRYLRWRGWIADDAEPAWDGLMQEIFTPR